MTVGSAAPDSAVGDGSDSDSGVGTTLRAALVAAVRQFGTPLYVLDIGAAASVVSAGEWLHARTGGLINRDIAFEGIGKTDSELRLAVHETAAGRLLRWLSVESARELRRLRQIAAAAGLGHGGSAPVDVLARLNPAVTPETRAEFAVGARTSKFGMSRDEILSLARDGYLTGSGIRLRGVHVHVGDTKENLRCSMY